MGARQPLEAPTPPPTTPAPQPVVNGRDRRLRSPLLMTVWALLAFEAIGGLVIFVARLAFGTTPGEALHVIVGLALVAAYAIYQWQHWTRVRPLRSRLDYTLGLFALGFMTLTLLTGLALGLPWWQARIVQPTGAEVQYPALLSAAHNVASLMVLAFVGGHLGAVLLRDRRDQERHGNHRTER